MYEYLTKVDGAAPAETGYWYAKEHNNIAEEMEQFAKTAGLSLTAPGTPPGSATDPDTRQAAQAAARYASGGVFYQDSGAANAYVLGSPLAFQMPKSYFDGMEIEFDAATPNTGASTVNVNGIGVKNLKGSDGLTVPAAVVSGRTVARFDAAADEFRLLPWSAGYLKSGIWITANTTITVGSSGADHTTIQDALASLDQKLIVPGVTVTISLAAETFAISSPIRIRHVHADRIQIVGASLTGSWPPATSANSTTARNNAQAVFGTEISCTGCIAFIVEDGRRIGLIKNILVIGDPTQFAFQFTDASGGTIDTCNVHGASAAVFVRDSGNVTLTNVMSNYAASAANGDFQSTNGSYIFGTTIKSFHAAGYAVMARDSSMFEINNAEFTTTGREAVISTYMSRIMVFGSGEVTTNTSNRRCLRANYRSNIYIQGHNVSDAAAIGTAFSIDDSNITLISCANVGALSPASGTVGNFNSYNRST